jgi:hypothetical protein
VESTQISTKACSVLVNETFEEILARHRKFNDVNGYIHVDRLPYQYGVPKFHKVPPGGRFIAGVCGEKRQQSEEPSVFEIFKRLPHEAYCSTTDASKWLSGKLQLVMELLQMKDNESFQKSGIRRCWFIRVIDEVFLEIKEQQELLKKKDPRTFDFSTMYTCLQHQLIKKNVRIAVEEAVEYAQYHASKEGKCLT